MEHPASPIFDAFMRALMLVRKRGVFGTSDDPREYEAGEMAPWWIWCRWPLYASLTFLVDVETYYEDGQQVVRPILEHAENVAAFDGYGRQDCLLFGAPTQINTTPRPRRRKRKPALFPQLGMQS